MTTPMEKKVPKELPVGNTKGTLKRVYTVYVPEKGFTTYAEFEFSTDALEAECERYELDEWIKEIRKARREDLARWCKKLQV